MCWGFGLWCFWLNWACLGPSQLIRRDSRPDAIGAVLHSPLIHGWLILIHLLNCLIGRFNCFHYGCVANKAAAWNLRVTDLHRSLKVWEGCWNSISFSGSMRTLCHVQFLQICSKKNKQNAILPIEIYFCGFRSNRDLDIIY